MDVVVVVTATRMATMSNIIHKIYSTTKIPDAITQLWRVLTLWANILTPSHLFSWWMHLFQVTNITIRHSITFSGLYCRFILLPAELWTSHASLSFTKYLIFLYIFKPKQSLTLSCWNIIVIPPLDSEIWVFITICNFCRFTAQLQRKMHLAK